MFMKLFVNHILAHFKSIQNRKQLPVLSLLGMKEVFLSVADLLE